MQDAFRFAGRPAGVQNVERIFRVDWHRVAIRVDIFHFTMPPHISPFLDRDLVTNPSKNDHLFYVFIIFQSLIHVAL